MISAEAEPLVHTDRARYRLDVQRPGTPLVPHSFHETFHEAWDMGELVLFGRVFAETDVLPDAPPGWDFIVREAIR